MRTAAPSRVRASRSILVPPSTGIAWRLAQPASGERGDEGTGTEIRLPALARRSGALAKVGLGQRAPGRPHQLAVLVWRRRRGRVHHGVVAVRRDRHPGLPAEALGIGAGLDGADALP